MKPEKNGTGRRVRISFFPKYREVRQLLETWPGWSRKQFTHLQGSLMGLIGDPQNRVEWTDPDTWIDERLSEDDRELARAIWAHGVNPRYTRGHWQLSQKYKLIDEQPGKGLQLTERGHEFLEHEGGAMEIVLDEQEGVAEILLLLDAHQPARVRDLLEEWAEYLVRHSFFNRPTTFRSTLFDRLKNLRARGLVSYEGSKYSFTDAGSAYLQRIKPENGDAAEDPAILVKKQRNSAREELRELLLKMNPHAFEHLVKRLLEAMDYQDVEVTPPSNDGGVDVVADIELGITSIREVVQVKRHRQTIGRKDLDALRGSLHRFHAFRGTIITTSKFSSGAEKAAFEEGAAPITLIDSDLLIDLLIEHRIGVHEHVLKTLSVDPGDLFGLESDDDDI